MKFIEFLNTNPVVEARTSTKSYEDSSDFEDAYSQVEQHIKAALAILESPPWREWMKATDANFGSNIRAVRTSEDLHSKLQEFEEEFDQLYDRMSDI